MPGDKELDLVDKLDALDGHDYSADIDTGNEQDDNEQDDQDTGDEDSHSDDLDELPPEKGGKQQQQKQPVNKDQQQNKQQQQKSDGKQQQQRQQEPARLRVRPDGSAVDARGNIVDPRDGTIIARAGSERRLWENGQRMRTELGERTNEIVALKKEVQDKEFFRGIPQQYNITNDELQQMFEIGITAKRNIVEGAKKMVALALAQGHNVTDILGSDAGNALEMGAVQRMLDEKLKPVLERTNADKAEQDKVAQRAANQRRVDKWVSEHDYADVHLATIDRLAGEYPDKSPDEIYYNLRSWCDRNGFDFSQPLQPQILARRQRKGNGRQQQRDDNNPNLNGRRRVSSPLPGGGNGRQQHRSLEEGEMADPNQDWASIIRQTMGN